MANVTIPGIGGSQTYIPVATTEATQFIAAAYAAILASVANNQSISPTGTAPADVNLQAGSTDTTVLNNATGPLTVNDASGLPVSVISGLGGLTYTSTGTPVAGVLIVAGGTNNTISLAQGTASVVADGNATISAELGGDTVYASAGGHALVNAGHGAVVYLAGQDTVNYYGTGAQIYAEDGADITTVSYNLGVGGGNANPINQAGTGSVTISAFGSSSGVFTGYAGNIVVDATAHGTNTDTHAGTILIDPEAANVLVLAGFGAETLFGTGDDGGVASNRGSDTVNSGNGYFHGGTGNNILETSATSAGATLVGGATSGNTDQLYSQGSWNTMIAGQNTTVMDAFGQSGPVLGLTSFSAAPTNQGNLIEAGAAVSVSIYGAAGGNNTVVSGTGATTVLGNHGLAGSSNIYMDGQGGSGTSGGSITIGDFVVGTDKFMLNGATVQPASIAGSSIISLSDGTKVTFVNVLVTTANQGNIFS